MAAAAAAAAAIPRGAARAAVSARDDLVNDERRHCSLELHAGATTTAAAARAKVNDRVAVAAAVAAIPARDWSGKARHCRNITGNDCAKAAAATATASETGTADASIASRTRRGTNGQGRTPRTVGSTVSARTIKEADAARPPRGACAATAAATVEAGAASVSCTTVYTNGAAGSTPAQPVAATAAVPDRSAYTLVAAARGPALTIRKGRGC
jgi:hypothetical protein